MEKITINNNSFVRAGFLALVFLTVIPAGCKNFTDLPEFSIRGPVCKGCQMSFDFYNNAGVEIKNIQVRMNVYDKKTDSPAEKIAVTVECAFDCSIMPLESGQFYASLEEYFEGVRTMELGIDDFYVSRVLYSNGRVWKDLFGFYSQFYSH